MNYTSAKEKCNDKGVMNAIARAYQMTDVVWTPITKVPYIMKTPEKGYFVEYYEPGVQVKGLPYSSVECVNGIVGDNVSFETFYSAVHNPESELYLTVVHSSNQNAATYYGAVCNGLVRYALGYNALYGTKNWFSIDGMKKIADAGKYSAEQVKLGDVLHTFNGVRNHVTLITDILYGEDGKVAYIEVSEEVRPAARREMYPVDIYFEKYKMFSLCRYDYISNVPEIKKSEFMPFTTDEENKVPFNPDLGLNLGNKANYYAGDKTTINILSDGFDTLNIIKDGKELTKFPLSGIKQNVESYFSAGEYEVKAIGKDKISDSVYFNVNDPCIVYYKNADVLELYVGGNIGSSKPKFVEMKLRENNIVQDELFENGAGRYTFRVPELLESFKVKFENDFGVWPAKEIKYLNDWKERV